MNDQISQINNLIKKINDGNSSPQEALALIATLNVSLDTFKILLEEVKLEQIRKNLK